MMPTITVTTYGEGGYDPDAPNGNVVETREIEAVKAVTVEQKIASALDAIDTNKASVADVVAALKSAFG